MDDICSGLSGFRDYLASKNSSPKTISTRITCLKPFLQFLAEHQLTILTATWQDIEKYVVQRLEKSPKSIDTYLTSLKVFYKFLLRKHIVESNPASLILLRKSYTLPRCILTVDEAERLLNEPDVKTKRGIRDRAILEAFYSSGLRLSELCNLSLYDCDTAKGDVRVKNGKCSRDRVIPIGNQACLWIRTYKQLVRPHWQKPDSGDWLFLGLEGHKIYSQVVYKMVVRYVKSSGIKKSITTHSLRHSCMTSMAVNGANVFVLQQIMGHKDLGSSQKYIHIAQEDVRKMISTCHPREIYGNGHTD